MKDMYVDDVSKKGSAFYDALYYTIENASKIDLAF